MMIPAKLVPVDPLVEQKIRLWLAAPDGEVLCKCLHAEARLMMTELAGDMVRQDLHPNETLKQGIEDKLAKVRRLRDFCSLVNELKEREDSFSTLQFL
jgi:hypothetical protein